MSFAKSQNFDANTSEAELTDNEKTTLNALYRKYLTAVKKTDTEYSFKSFLTDNQAEYLSKEGRKNSFSEWLSNKITAFSAGGTLADMLKAWTNKDSSDGKTTPTPDKQGFKFLGVGIGWWIGGTVFVAAAAIAGHFYFKHNAKK